MGKGRRKLQALCVLVLVRERIWWPYGHIISLVCTWGVRGDGLCITGQNDTRGSILPQGSAGRLQPFLLPASTWRVHSGTSGGCFSLAVLTPLSGSGVPSVTVPPALRCFHSAVSPMLTPWGPLAMGLGLHGQPPSYGPSQPSPPSHSSSPVLRLARALLSQVPVAAFPVYFSLALLPLCRRRPLAEDLAMAAAPAFGLPVPPWRLPRHVLSVKRCSSLAGVSDRSPGWVDVCPC